MDPTLDRLQYPWQRMQDPSDPPLTWLDFLDQQRSAFGRRCSEPSELYGTKPSPPSLEDQLALATLVISAGLQQEPAVLLEWAGPAMAMGSEISIRVHYSDVDQLLVIEQIDEISGKVVDQFSQHYTLLDLAMASAGTSGQPVTPRQVERLKERYAGKASLDQ